jgi:limonene-1,2-epoxide hydrolase
VTDTSVYVEGSTDQARLDVNLIAGVRVTFHVTAIFEVRDGAITCWREYWDTGDIARQLGSEAPDMVEQIGS